MERQEEDKTIVATFLACAGLNRLGRKDISSPIEPEDMLPAIAQGCIGIELPHESHPLAHSFA